MIAHLALSRIELDLDDGVKVNYEKFKPPATERNTSFWRRFEVNDFGMV